MKLKLKKKILFFLFCGVNHLLCGQMLPYEKYTTKNGLISDRITAIAQDEKGFMWFGSYFGVCRYDGIRFEKIELPAAQQNKYVNSLLAANNKMYMAFSFVGGLAEYSNGKVRAYFIKGKDSSSANEFACMSNNQDGSILICNTANQVYQFSNGVFTWLYTLPPTPMVTAKSILKDQYKNIWVATEKGLFILPPPYTSHKTYFPNEYFCTLTKDANNKIWFSHTNGKTTITGTFEGFENGRLLKEKILNRSHNSKLSTFGGNTSNGFWLANATTGLTSIDGEGKTASFQVPLDFNSDIKVLFADRENNIWIANDPGVLKISNFTNPSYLFNEMGVGGGALTPQNDSLIWASNANSLYTITNQSIQKIPFPYHSDYFGVLHVDAQKNLWIAYWNGGIRMMQWQKDKLTNKKYFSEFNKVKIKAQAIVEDHQGNMWIGGMNGIFRIKNNHIVERYQPVNASGNPAFISCMAIDEESQTLWLGDNALGLIKLHYKAEINRPFTYTVTGYVSAKNGLTDSYTRSLLVDKQKNIWVGTRYGGIYQVKATGKGFLATNFNVPAKLSCTRVTDIASQDSSAVWFATCDGMYKYSYHTRRWEHYNTSDGLLNSEVFSVHVDAKKGYVWALSLQGLTRLPVNVTQSSLPPLINITAINILGNPDSLAMFSNATVAYNYTQNSIGFSFAGASYMDEKRIKYKYMLQGYDKAWSEPTAANSINFASLPPGSYVFKVLAANANGQWSRTPASFQFKIIRPFYKSPWFVFFLFTAGLCLIYIIRFQQLKQRFKIEKLRLAIARDLHDDVGSTLGSINILSKTASRRIEHNSSAEEVVPIFQKIGQSAENTLEAMDDIVWAINPGKDKTHDLMIRMREFAIPLLEAKNISFNFVVEGDQNLPIPMNLRRNAFLIFKESVHNILKHSGATRVDIGLHITAGKFSLNVSDNGKGFPVHEGTHRNGLKNLQNRAEMMGGTLKIQSSTKGTSILVLSSLR